MTLRSLICNFRMFRSEFRKNPKKYVMLNCRKQLTVFGIIYSAFLMSVMMVGSLKYVCEPMYGANNYFKSQAFAYVVLIQSVANIIMFKIRAKYNRFSYLLQVKSGRKELPDLCKRLQARQSKCKTVTFRTVYCARCDMRVAHICHHCPMCDYCVFKRDHHCFFLSDCVAYGNQRHFVVYLFWAMMGSCYALYLVLDFIKQFFPQLIGFSHFIIPWYLAKVVLRGRWNMFEFCYVIYLSLVMFCLISSVYFFINQCHFIYQCTSMMEHFRAQDLFLAEKSPTIGQRLRIVFGPYWLLNFVLPLPFQNELEETFQGAMVSYYLELATSNSAVGKKKST